MRHRKASDWLEEAIILGGSLFLIFFWTFVIPGP